MKGLGSLALVRLQQKPIAWVASLVLLGMALACFTAPWWWQINPAATALWRGALPPGATAPAVGEQVQFSQGQAPKGLLRPLDHGTLQVKWWEQAEYQDVRVLLRRGVVSRLQRMQGLQLLSRLDIPPGSQLREIGPDHTLGPILEVQSLVVHESAAPALKALERDVVLLRLAPPPTLRSAEISVVGGQVEHLAETLQIRAQDVQTLAWNGSALMVWHPLGSDELGRDLLARTLAGGRISLAVGVVATLASVTIGIVYGLIAGWYGGRLDRFLMATVDVLYAIPFLFLVILLLTLFGRDALVLFAALGAVQWLTTARIVRGSTLALREQPFVAAARLAGLSTPAILARHILPNCLGPVVVAATLTVPVVILEESFLAFIGLQVEWQGQALDSWGALVHHGARAAHPWLLLVPAIAMALTLLSLNMLGDCLRDAVDPRLETRR